MKDIILKQKNPSAIRKFCDTTEVYSYKKAVIRKVSLKIKFPNLKFFIFPLSLYKYKKDKSNFSKSKFNTQRNEIFFQLTNKLNYQKDILSYLRETFKEKFFALRKNLLKEN